MAGDANNNRPYEMTINLTVLEHLGIGLYSNVPAVLSEVVANCWDADAHEVEIELDTDRGIIVIEDDGMGMDRRDINQKYLTVGYQRRKVDGDTTPDGRDVMGRKGIGKLSVFSIAAIAEVFSTKEETDEVYALRLNRKDIREKIERDPESTYYPDPIEPDGFNKDKGTRIVLRELDKKLSWTEKYLRRRLARRFSVIGPENDFEVSVNGTRITPADREFYNKLEFMWHFGAEGEQAKRNAKGLQHTEEMEGTVSLPDRDEEVTGWIGTVESPEDVEDANNAIVVLAHGKLAHEDILPEFGEAAVYADYVIGELNADFLDETEREDIITSGRQAVKEDDPRYRALSNFVQRVLKTIKSQWSELRKERGKEKALQNEALEEWYEGLRGDSKKYAEKMFGKIESLSIGDQESKAELYRSSVLAFEKLSLRDMLSVLNDLEDADLDLLTKLFANIDEIEASHYYEIIKGRLEVLDQFMKLVPESKERALQEYIFDHLWLLDASWERAATNERIEEAVTKEFEDLDDRLTEKEKKGRIDIRYRSAAGKHIIVELKKYDRTVNVHDLNKQLEKYRNALEKVLEQRYPSESHDIEIISIMGSPPSPKANAERNRRLLREMGARTVTYDELIRDNRDRYQDYLEKRREMSDLVELADRIASGFLEEDNETEKVEPEAA